MFAQVSGLEVGTLTHNIGDCHIYDRHIPLVEKLIEMCIRDRYKAWIEVKFFVFLSLS